MLSFKITTQKTIKRKDGQTPLYIRITNNRKIHYIKLDYLIPENDFDDNKSIVTKSNKNHISINLYVSQCKAKTEKILFDMQVNNINFDIDLFKSLFFNNKNINDKIDFFDFAEKEIELKKPEIALRTYRQLKGELSKLRKFKTIIHIDNIDFTFLQSYEFYMRNSLNNATNTVEKTFKKLRTFLNIAVNKNLITDNPFDKYKIKHEKTNRSYLTINEIKKLEDFYFETNNNKIKNVMQYYLFACYTGLRFQDVQDLKWTNIENNTNIKLRQLKTNIDVFIPLISNAKRFLPEKTSERIFKVVSNQKTNDYLKVAASFCDINKTITFHTARHTFATLALNNEIPMEVVSKLLGHENLKTTQIYAKLLESTKIREMDKLDKRLNSDKI